jgi:mannosyltransferase OCH1-like enzyme
MNTIIEMATIKDNSKNKILLFCNEENDKDKDESFYSVNELYEPIQYRINQLEQTNILDVHYKFGTDYPNNYVAIFKKVGKGRISVNVYILSKDKSTIPALTFRITGGSQRILCENTKYPIELQYDDIYLVLPQKRSHTIIPKTIIQTHNSAKFTKELFITQKIICDLNPDYEYIYFNDKQCSEFISTYFSYHVVKAYQTLTPGAYKADFFRYCYLYIHGGVYIDLKSVLQLPLHSILHYKLPLILVHDLYPISISNIFIASGAKNPLFEDVIRYMTKQILAKNKGENLYDITGSVALGKAFNSHLKKPLDTKTELTILPHTRILYHSYDIPEKLTSIKTHYNRIILYKTYSSYYDKQNTFQHWTDWETDSVFIKTHEEYYDFLQCDVDDYFFPLLNSQAYSFSPVLSAELSHELDLRYASDVQNNQGK